MTTTQSWWEDIFEGDLALGINKERLAELDDENFLFFKEEDEDYGQLHS